MSRFTDEGTGVRRLGSVPCTLRDTVAWGGRKFGAQTGLVRVQDLGPEAGH